VIIFYQYLSDKYSFHCLTHFCRVKVDIQLAPFTNSTISLWLTNANAYVSNNITDMPAKKSLYLLTISTIYESHTWMPCMFAHVLSYCQRQPHFTALSCYWPDTARHWHHERSKRENITLIFLYTLPSPSIQTV